MAKAYLCPHCDARNRFNLEATSDGVVRCGACAKAFLLPDFVKSPAKAEEVDTAIIDSRTGEVRGPGFEERDTAIVDSRTGEKVGNTPTWVGPADGATDGARDGNRWTAADGGGARRVPGSAEATLIVHDKPAEPAVRGSQAPTVLVLDAVVGHAPSVREKQERVVRSQMPTLMVVDGAPEALQSRPTEPVPLHEKETVQAGGIPPAGLLSSSTADTQPTNPPPEYVEALAAAERALPSLVSPVEDSAPSELPRSARDRPTERLEDPLAGTQPGVVADPRIRTIGWAATAVLVAGLALGASYYADVRIESRTESKVLEWSAGRAAARSASLVGLIRAFMMSGEPDRARRVVAVLGSDGGKEQLLVLRADGTRAFGDDWGTYREVLKAACDQDRFEERTTKAPQLAKKARAAWLGGADRRLAGLGPGACRSAKVPAATPGSLPTGLPARFLEHVAEAGPNQVVSWVDDSGGSRAQVVVQPIVGEAACAGCHTKIGAEAPLGYVVVTIPLESVDAVLSGNRSTLIITGVVAALLLVLVLLLAVRLFGLRSTAI